MLSFLDCFGIWDGWKWTSITLKISVINIILEYQVTYPDFQLERAQTIILPIAFEADQENKMIGFVDKFDCTIGQFTTKVFQSIPQLPGQFLNQEIEIFLCWGLIFSCLVGRANLSNLKKEEIAF